MPTPETAPKRSRIPAGPILGVVVAGGVILLLGSLVPPEEETKGLAILRILLLETWPAIVWLLAALGLGSGLLRLLPTVHSRFIDSGARIRGAWPLGIALLLIIDATLGDLGLLGRDRGFVAWGLVLAAGIPGSIVLVRSLLAGRTTCGPLMPGLVLAIPIAVLLAAATSIPGWLCRASSAATTP